MNVRRHTDCRRCGSTLQKCGRYTRKSDGRRVQRYRCSQCKKYTSDAVLSTCYGQNKRHLNRTVERLLCSAVSQRRIALILGVTRTTVARKFEFLAAEAARKNKKWREEIEPSSISKVYIDEMEDRIHTKCKPVSIALCVSPDRKILGHQSSRMRPKNKKLNELSKKKYPSWTPEERNGFERLVVSLQPILHQNVEVCSDEKSFYPKILNKHFPLSHHKRFRSRRAVVAGQGELKEGGRDPLFALNHTCAMLRANINRLVRRTWCTSKKISSLQKHIEIYTHFHNSILT